MKRIATLAAVGLTMGWAAAVLAGEDAGAAFLKINPSVRGEALGGMNPVSAFGAAGMGVNPASLALMQGNEFASGFASMLGGSQYGTAGVGFRRGEGSAIGGSATMLRSGTLEGRDMNGDPAASFTAQDLSVGITGAASVGKALHVGATVKGVREEIGNETSNTAAALDLGAVLETGSVAWGLSALNVGGKLKFGGKEVSLPSVYGLGVSVPLGGGLAALGGMSLASGETTANAGVEYRLGPVNLRGGYRSDGGNGGLARSAQKTSEQALGGLTGGIGVVLGSLRIDYAVSQTAVEWGMGQRASVTWKWGGDEEKARPRRPERRETPRAYKPAPWKDSSVSTGSHRAYDPAPLQKSKSKKRWVD